MAITSPVYCCREDVKSALDIKDTFRNNAQVDRAIMSAATDIYGMLHRRFYPVDGTKYWDWPNWQGAAPWRLWFDQHDLVTGHVGDCRGCGYPSRQRQLRAGQQRGRRAIRVPRAEPLDHGGVQRRADTAAGRGDHRDVGLLRHHGTRRLLAAAISDTTGTTVTCTDSSAVGVGQILLIGTERMLVIERAMADTGVSFAGLTAASNDNQVAVPDVTAFTVGEVIRFDAERCLVADTVPGGLVVKRAWDGTVLAAHTGGTIYAARQLTVIRGGAGHYSGHAWQRGGGVQVGVPGPGHRTVCRAVAQRGPAGDLGLCPDGR